MRRVIPNQVSTTARYGLPPISGILLKLRFFGGVDVVFNYAGDPARANILIALMSGKALTATELASEAGVTVQTTSSHLKKLEAVGLLKQRKQGRHRYFALFDEDVASLLESMMGLAAKRGLVRTQTGPKDLALRKARVCYNHLAGDLGVKFYDAMVANGHLIEQGDDLGLTDAGAAFVEKFGIDLTKLGSGLVKSKI